MAPGELAHPLANARLGAVLHRQVIEEPAQVLGEVAGAGISAIRLEFQALGDQGIEAPGESGGIAPAATARGAGSRSACASISRTGSRAGWGREGGLAGEHLEEDQAEGVDVGPLVDGVGRGRAAGVERVEVLGRHVGQRAADQGAVEPRPRADSGWLSAARLKSSSIGVPSAASRMLAGFRSRWSKPREWAWSSPSASRATIQTAAWMAWPGARTGEPAGAGPLDRLRPGRPSASGAVAPTEPVEQGSEPGDRRRTTRAAAGDRLRSAIGAAGSTGRSWPADRGRGAAANEPELGCPVGAGAG